MLEVVWRHTPRLVSLVMLALVLLTSARPAAASNPTSLLVSNVRDTLFTVSWLSAVPESGQVHVIGERTYDDDRGASYSGTTHYVTIAGLKPETQYRFDVISGGARYDNERAHYTVVTGATLQPPTPDPILGRVQNPDGSMATDAIVVFTIHQEASVSAPLSMLMTLRDQGFFHINLSDARVQGDLARYFAFGEADLLTIQAVSAAGMGSLRLPAGDPRLRAKDQNQTVVITQRTGAETPTLIVRQPTPTVIPPAPPMRTDGLLVGAGVAVVVVLGILLIAIQFVWRR